MSSIFPEDFRNPLPPNDLRFSQNRTGHFGNAPRRRADPPASRDPPGQPGISWPAGERKLPENGKRRSACDIAAGTWSRANRTAFAGFYDLRGSSVE